jgi:hypothetical protein
MAIFEFRTWLFDCGRKRGRGGFWRVGEFDKGRAAEDQADVAFGCASGGIEERSALLYVYISGAVEC